MLEGRASVMMTNFGQWSNPLSPSLRNIIKAVLVAQDHCQRE